MGAAADPRRTHGVTGEPRDHHRHRAEASRRNDRPHGPPPAAGRSPGIGAGVAGIVSVVASGLAGAVYDPTIAGDAVAITARLAEHDHADHGVPHRDHGVGAAAGGVRRRPAPSPRRPRSAGVSLLPGVAASGLLLVAVAQLLGSGLTTEFVFGVADPDLLVPETAAVFGHWIGTIPWLWGSAGLTALAVAVASLRHGRLPRWLGVTSLVLGGLATLLRDQPAAVHGGHGRPDLADRRRDRLH